MRQRFVFLGETRRSGDRSKNRWSVGVNCGWAGARREKRGGMGRRRPLCVGGKEIAGGVERDQSRPGRRGDEAVVVGFMEKAGQLVPRGIDSVAIQKVVKRKIISLNLHGEECPFRGRKVDGRIKSIPKRILHARGVVSC